MRNIIFYCIFSFLLLNCSNEEKEINGLFPSSIETKQIFNKKLATTSFTEYKLTGRLDTVNYSNYPINIWKDQGWKVKHWSNINTKNELKDIISFLIQERNKFNYSKTNNNIIIKFDTIINNLKNKTNTYFIAYFYKEKPGENRMPPDSNKIYTGWLFFYYLDINNKKMFRITNAYR